MIGYVFLALYALTIPVANWMIGNVGQCVPDGPCLIPVGFGLMAPSGVLMIGAALVARDFVQEQLGLKWALFAIAIGATISAAISPPYIVAASVAAFLISELADLAVYTPLRKRGLALAVAASGAVGAAVDSVAFLFIAFGSLDFVAGQIVGKIWASVAAAGVIVLFRAALARKGGA